MNGNGFKCTHLPDHRLFCATQAGSSDSDGPHAWNLVEMARRASGMGDRTFAAELVQAPALAMPFVAERSRKAARVEVRAPGAIFVDHAIVGEPGAAELIQLRQLAHGHVFQNNSQQVVWIGRATRK